MAAPDDVAEDLEAEQVAPPDESPSPVPGAPVLEGKRRRNRLSKRQKREAKQRLEAEAAGNGTTPGGGDAVAGAPPSEELCSVSGSEAPVEQPADAVAVTIELASPTSTASGDSLGSPRLASNPAGPWDWPLPVRVLLFVGLYPLLMLVTAYTLVMDILLVTPIFLLSRLCCATRALAVARFVAQRPLLVLSYCVTAPLLYGTSYGIDFSALSSGHPATVRDLVSALRPGKRGKRVFGHMRYARNQVAAAGVTASWVPDESMWIGVEHRRLILHHSVSHNTTAPGILFVLMSYINLAHLVAANGVEFRSGDGRLVGFALFAPGAYSCGTIFAQRTELSRCGMWAVAMTMALERMCVPADGPEASALREQPKVFDVGPTFGAQKGLLGMHPLRYGSTFRAAWKR